MGNVRGVLQLRRALAALAWISAAERLRRAPAARSRTGARALPLGAASLLLGAASLLLGGCEGDNLFRTGGTSPTAPVVDLSSNVSSAEPGDNIELQVIAFDNSGLSVVGFTVREQAGTLIDSVDVAVVGVAFDSIFSFLVPIDLQPMTVRALGFAADAGGIRAVSDPVDIVVTESTP
jgi:hypothetical protein